MDVTEVTLDADAVAQLKNGEQRLKLRDASGRLLGIFVPASEHRKSPFSREELERRYREGAATARPLKEWFAEMNEKYPGEFQWDSP
jgi:hypothetical protein